MFGVTGKGYRAGLMRVDEDGRSLGQRRKWITTAMDTALWSVPGTLNHRWIALDSLLWEPPAEPPTRIKSRGHARCGAPSFTKESPENRSEIIVNDVALMIRRRPQVGIRNSQYLPIWIFHHYYFIRILPNNTPWPRYKHPLRVCISVLLPGFCPFSFHDIHSFSHLCWFFFGFCPNKNCWNGHNFAWASMEK